MADRQRLSRRHLLPEGRNRRFGAEKPSVAYRHGGWIGLAFRRPFGTTVHSLDKPGPAAA
jgi:hypothetical protein